ncbi:glycosyltransferase [Pseudodesulfovibrio sp.]|uniref:glycosyltransferase n=1 Tax=unclassified Pseudodesulfovibrio TaxID=2661612 RepID=UPI003B00B135
MRLLVTHNNFPAQFRHICEYLGRTPGNQVIFATKNPRKEWTIPGVDKLIFTPDDRKPEAAYAPTRIMEDNVRHGLGLMRALVALKKKGFVPDVILGHSGWGQTMFLQDVYPDTPIVSYFEWFYNAQGRESTFENQHRSEYDKAMLRMRNSAILHDLIACRVGISPTNWQRSQFPLEFQPKIVQTHDGINTRYFAPLEEGVLPLEKLDIPGVDLTGAKELVTYCARGLEPYRGFPQFYDSLPAILEDRPDCHVLIVADDRVCYSPKLPDGQSYKQQAIERTPVDEKRVHFCGTLPYGKYKEVLLASSAHVYLTWPFVLSWSFLEAMACGCLLIGSNTDPVREVLVHKENGLLTDFHDPQKIAGSVIYALRHQDRLAELRHNARRTVLDRYCLSKCLPLHLRLLNDVAQEGPRKLLKQP